MHDFFREAKTIFRVTHFSKPALTPIGIEILCLHLAYVSFLHTLILVEGDLKYLAGDKVTKLGLVDRFPLLHAEDVRREYLVGLAVVANNAFWENLVIGEGSHRMKPGQGAVSYKKCLPTDRQAAQNF